MDEVKLKQLQVLVLEKLLVMIAEDDTCTPGMIQAALRFLSDNQIQSLPQSGAGLKRDAERAPFKIGVG